MRVSVWLSTIGVVGLLALGACGRRPLPGPPAVYPPECDIVPAPSDGADSVTVASLGAIEPQYAPWARNASERLLFYHLYETLITIDCLEDVRPGLAVSWERGKGGRRWTFELREGAQFWDGTPVTAADVARSWRHAAFEPMTLYALIDSAAAAGRRTLHVYLKRRHREVPRALSAPEFAVTKPSENSRWPLGSGPYEVAPFSGGMITARPAFRMKGPVIRFLEASAIDARDLLEGVIDVMVTVDPAVVEYAAGRSRLATVALPWDRTYLLLSTSRVQSLREGGRPGAISPDLSDRLARDAVRGDARGCRSTSWWDELRGCGELSVTAPGLTAIPRGSAAASGVCRILYDSDDGIARDLAERIVALAATDPSTSPEAAGIVAAVPGLVANASGMMAEGVTRGELDLSLRNGDDFAYVVSVPRRPPDPCYGARQLIDRAPWLATVESDLPEALLPLVDTRVHAIADRERVGLIIDWYGNMLIVNGMLGWR